MKTMPAVRVIVRDRLTGIFHRGIRIGGSSFTYAECYAGPADEVESLPADIEWKLVHECLRDQTLNTRGPNGD